MIHKKYVTQRAEAASRLLSGNTFSSQSLEAVNSLIRGLDPVIDKTLDQCAAAFSNLKTYEKSSIVELSDTDSATSAEMPAEQKSYRLRCIHSWRDLESRVSAIANETTGEISPIRVEFLRLVRQLQQPTTLVGTAVLLIAVGILINFYSAHVPAPIQSENGQVQGIVKESTSEATLVPSPVR